MKFYDNGKPWGREPGYTPPDHFKIRKEDKAHGLRFQGKRNEEGKEVGEGFLTREEARKMVDRVGEGPYKLDLGCGSVCREGYVGIDNSTSVNAPLQLNLDQDELPFDDNSIEEISCYHFLEHVQNLIPLMNECYRVLKPRGMMHIRVPFVPHLQAFQDPTHVRFFTTESFKYWDAREFLWQHVGSTYGIIPFSEMNQKIENTWELVVSFRK